MSNLASVLDTQKIVEASLVRRLADFEKQLKSAKDNMSLTTLSSEFAAFREEVFNILQLLRQQICELIDTVDAVDMRHRRKYLLINGIPENPSQNLAKDLLEIFQAKFQLKDSSSNDLKSITRLGRQTEGKTRPVLICFSNMNLKDILWRRKACLKGTPMVISEFLTRRRQDLFITARKQLGIKNCWTMNGDIFVKSADGTVKRIRNENEVQNLIDKHNPNISLNIHTQESSSSQVEFVETSKQRRTARARK